MISSFVATLLGGTSWTLFQNDMKRFVVLSMFLWNLLLRDKLGRLWYGLRGQVFSISIEYLVSMSLQKSALAWSVPLMGF
jgi:hypothetical protein